MRFAKQEQKNMAATTGICGMQRRGFRIRELHTSSVANKNICAEEIRMLVGVRSLA